MAAKVGLVKPQDHIVCVQRMGESFVIKIVSVNDSGDGVEIIRPKSLINLIRVSAWNTIILSKWNTIILSKCWSCTTFEVTTS